MKTNLKPLYASLLAAGLIFAASQPAGAAVTFSATGTDPNPGGSALAASATFDIVSGNLQVILTNTSSADVLIPSSVLSAVFFDISGNPALTPVSALISAGSTWYFDSVGATPGTTSPLGNVGGEWEYLSGLSGAPYGATRGISSSGFGLFGSANFGGPDLAPPVAVDGLNYAITSAGDNLASGNAAVTGNVPLIQNSVTFLLGSLPAGFSLTQIGNVSFQYGTALTDPSLVPEPETYAMMLAGLGLMGFVARRRSRPADPA